MLDTRLAFIVAPLLVAGTVAGVLVDGGSPVDGLSLAPAETDAQDSDEGCSVSGEFAFPSEAEVESWSGEVPADASGGAVHAVGYDGGVDVATWDQDRYEVQVAEVDPDDELEPTVEADTGNGTFSLAVSVENTNRQEVGPYTVDVGVGDRPEAHVQVRIPDKAYDGLAVDTHPDENGTVHLQAHVDPSVDPENGSVMFSDDEDANPVLLQDLQAQAVSAEAHDRGILAAGLQADEAALGTHDGDACLRDTSHGNLEASSHDGSLHLEAVEADAAHLDTHDGDVVSPDLAGASLSASTHDGAIDLALEPTDSGSVELDSHDGSIAVSVPTDGNHGYDVLADTHDGSVSIQLPNVVVEDGSADEEDEGGGDQVHARTQGFDDRPVQVQLDAESHDGDVTVASR